MRAQGRISKEFAVAAIFIAVALGIVGWRSLAAWWADDWGNRELLRGRDAEALAWFDRGLRYQPNWGILHEDRGRALLENDPATALKEFVRAACGPPCSAEEGDALVRLGKPEAANGRYIAASAVSRIAGSATQLAAQGKYNAALALERALIERLRDDFFERANLASAYATVGRIESAAAAAAARPDEARRHERESVRAFSAATELAPFNEGYLLAYAFAELRWGDVDAARRAFRRLLQLHPHQSDAEAALTRLGKSNLNDTRP